MNNKRSAILYYFILICLFAMHFNYDTFATSQETVLILNDGQIIDTFNGVPAIYITGTGNSNTGTYSCAGYVNNYYKTVYGIGVSNLVMDKTPVATYGSFFQTANPEPGDIGYHRNGNGTGGHWFIIKEVNSDGAMYVIEQNWKWASDGKTYCYKNRRVEANHSYLKVFRWSEKSPIMKPDKSVLTNFKSFYAVTNNTINIQWTAASGASTYVIDVWKGGDHVFSKDVGNVTSYDVNCFGSNGRYGVAVTACNSVGRTDGDYCYTDVWYGAPEKTRLLNFSSFYLVNNNTIGIAWEKVNGAATYVIDVWKGSDHVFSKDVGNVTSYNVNCFGSNGKYGVAVTACNSVGRTDGDYSYANVWYGLDVGDDFDAIIENQENQYVLTANETNGNVIGAPFEKNKCQIWHFIRYSDSSYTIVNELTGKNLGLSGQTDNNGDRIGTYENNHGGLDQRFFIYDRYGAYNLRPVCSNDRVIDLDKQNNTVSIWTAASDYWYGPQSFSIKKIDMPSVANLSCAGGDSYSGVTFNWNRGTNTDGYTLKIWDGKHWEGEIIKEVRIQGADKTSTTVKLPPGNYEAYIDSWNTYSYIMSNVVSFSVEQGQPPAPVELGKPVFTNEKVLFLVQETATISWNFDPLVEWYVLWVYHNNECIINGKNIGKVNSYSLPNLQQGVYRIFVTACNQYGNTISDELNLGVSPYGTQTISDGDYHIVSALDSAKTIAVKDKAFNSGANIQLWSSIYESEQVFHVAYVGYGYYEITNINSGLRMDLADAGLKTGTNIWQCTPNDSYAQKWIIKESGDGNYYNIISGCNGLYVDVENGDSSNGTNILSCVGNGSNAQKWKFVRPVNYCTIEQVEDTIVYDGEAKEPTFRISDKGTVLAPGKDYTVAYTDNVNAGEAQAIISGIGNYSGVIRKKYVIKKAEQSIENVPQKVEKRFGDEDFSLLKEYQTYPNVSFSSGDKNIVTVDNTGAVKIIGVGETWITITFPGNNNYAECVKKVQVVIEKGIPQIEASPVLIKENTPCTSINKIYVRYNGNGNITYKTDDSDLLSVNNDGLIILTGRTGEAIVHILASETKQFRAGSIDVLVRIEKIQHSYDPTVIKHATCTEEGVTEYKCKNCGNTYEQLIPAMGHTIVEDKLIAPTCETFGLTAGRHCETCGEVLTKQEEISPTGHTLTTIKGTVPTCTEAGLTDGEKCVVCNKVINARKEIPATGHAWGDWATVKKATFEEEGLEQRICENDNSHIESRTVPMIRSYTISYHLDGGSNSEDNPKRYAENTVITLYAPTKEHYSFLGWYLTEKGDELLSDSEVYNCNLDVYARWERKTYTVTFNTNIQGVENPLPKTIVYGESVGTLPVCKKEGFIFTGWYLDKSGTIRYHDDSVMDSGDLLLYGQWKRYEDISILKLPENTEVVESEAFANLNCEAIIIPKGCMAIRSRAFADNHKLIYVEIPNSVRSLAEDAFEGCVDIIISYY